jgi:hypothetical protein
MARKIVRAPSPLSTLAPTSIAGTTWLQPDAKKDGDAATLLADFRSLAEAHGQGTWAVSTGYLVERDVLGLLVVFPEDLDAEARTATARELIAWTMLAVDEERERADHLQVEGTAYGDSFERGALRIFPSLSCALYLLTDDEELAFDDIFAAIALEPSRFTRQRAPGRGAALPSMDPLDQAAATPIGPALATLVRGPAVERLLRVAASGHIVESDVLYQDGETLSLTLDTVVAGLSIVCFPDGSPVTGSPADILELLDEKGLRPIRSVQSILRRPAGTPAQNAAASVLVASALAELAASRPPPAPARRKRAAAKAKKAKKP